MKKEEIKKLAENKDLISGIYNYCDRWCERCAFTSRCMNFAMSRKYTDDPEASDITNEKFWQNLSEFRKPGILCVRDSMKQIPTYSMRLRLFH